MDAIFGYIGKKKRQKIKAEREKTLERELVRGQIERVETHPTTTLSVRGRNDDDMVQRTRLKSGQKPCFGDIVKINTDQKGTVLGTVIGIMRKQDWDHGTTYYLRLGRTAQKKGWFGTSWHDDNVDAEEIVRASHATLVKRQHIALEEALVAKFEDKNSTADQKISALERLVEVLGDAENPQKKIRQKKQTDALQNRPGCHSSGNSGIEATRRRLTPSTLHQ